MSEAPPQKILPKIAAVIPCYRVKRAVLQVIKNCGPEVSSIVVVDDACPEHTADIVERENKDPRVVIVRLPVNQGVGGAVVAGYRRALELGAEILVKVDGDGQIDPRLILKLVAPLVAHRSDYVKGNRFYRLESLKRMPFVRLVGNIGLSFITKLSSGYWNLMDPTNGFTAIWSSVVRELPLEKLDKRYFFESDLLFRLYSLRAVVADVPMDAVYEGEVSNLNIAHSALTFPGKHLRNLGKRLFYSYVLRDFNLCSLQLILAFPLIFLGALFGAYRWLYGMRTATPATSGTVMLAALPVLIGVQFLLSAIQFDLGNVPREPRHREG